MGRELIKENIPELIPNFWGLSNKLSVLVFSLRIKKGMTQNDLAKELDVDPEVIYRLEGGSKEITIGFYEKVLLTLGLSYEEMDELIQ
ncbi:helix-turn-helix transcriptional regulator [Bacillus xiapuensis]|uniref:Helix-turn-helix transcriptional regulator n=1 Tax=Bacillus xiapuensis TaxID=2014075 RepID=A0ABU6NA06_9BACI|nr:helix-turn-helix transcriptional regulator [Bacillus xiapuensis]